MSPAAVKKDKARECLMDTSGSSDDVDGALEEPPSKLPKLLRQRKFWLFCSTCLWCSCFLALFFIPMGKTPANDALDKLLQTTPARLARVCKYKQYNNGIWPLFYIGKQSNGDPRSPDLLWLYHHEGLVLELVKSGGAQFLELEFSRHGLRYTSSISAGGPPLIRDTMQWDNSGCTFWCGVIPQRNSDPKHFAEEIDVVRWRHYNGFTFNCFEFSDRLWSYLSPVNQTYAFCESAKNAT